MAHISNSMCRGFGYKPLGKVRTKEEGWKQLKVCQQHVQGCAPFVLAICKRVSKDLG